MESDVLLVSDDFMIVREKDALMYGLEAGRNLSRMTSDTIKSRMGDCFYCRFGRSRMYHQWKEL